MLKMLRLNNKIRRPLLNQFYSLKVRHIYSSPPPSSSSNSFESLFEQTEKTDFSNMLPIKKNVYNESDASKELSQEQISQMMKESEISLSEAIRPVVGFDSLPVDPVIQNELMHRFKEPTTIQKFSWPVALSGNNLVGLSMTGSGKTLSFGIPMLQHIKENRIQHVGKTLGCIVLPSWELARQVHAEISRLSSLVRIYGTVLVGGEPINIQLRNLNSNKDFIVATPGRLMDMFTRGILQLKDISFIVLDEADRMMNMGFEPQIRSIMDQIRPDRQCTLWSATWPSKVSSVAQDYLQESVKIKVGQGSLTANKNIDQKFEFISAQSKITKVVDVLKNDYPDVRALVFCNTMSNVDFVANRLKSEGVSSVALHGKKERYERNHIFKSYKEKKYRVLVATDVASRGLDIDDVNLVVVFDMPDNLEDYVHRIGRTGRNKKGTSVSFFTSADVRLIQNLMELLKQSGKEIPEKMEAIWAKMR